MCFRCEIKNRLTGSIFLNVNHCHSQHPFHRFVRAYMRDIYTRVREYAAHTGLRCEAYLANDDITACEAIAAFRELGYAVPKDIAIAGFDNSLLAREISPKLTALAQPLEEIGKKAAAGADARRCACADVRAGIARDRKGIDDPFCACPELNAGQASF